MLYPVLQDPLRPIVSSLFDRPRGASIGQMLFGAGEQGAWYDPSDLSTLFQDSAGTTPVTAVEQPVGLILDKSKGLVQDNGTSVMNMLATSESLQSGWVYNGLASVTATPAAITGTTATGYKGIGRGVSLVSGTAYQLAVDFKANGYTKVYLSDIGNGRMPATSFDLVALTASRAEATITDIGDGWRRCVLPFTASGAGTSQISFAGYPDAGATLSAYGVHYTGDGVSGVLMRRPDLRLASNAAVDPLYQRTDAFMGLSVLYAGNHAGQATTTKRPVLKIDAGGCYYLSFDGVDDALQTGNINFTSTDKMTVWAGVTKLSDAATGTVVELSASKSANNGVFALFAPLTLGSPDISWYSKGTNERVASSTSESAPVTRVITGIGNISGDISSLRVNGAVVQTNTSDQGTGNFGNYPLYLGARAGTSLYFNGRLYGLIVRGAQSSLSQIEATELYIKQKMRLP